MNNKHPLVQYARQHIQAIITLEGINDKSTVTAAWDPARKYSIRDIRVRTVVPSYYRIGR